MHSVPSPSANKPQISDYTRIRARSIRFLILLAAVLALAFFLSLRAGSYNTPAAELIRGIFGRASDAKINLVIRNNRLPRICTAMVSGAGLGLAGCILQSVLRNPLASASTLGVSQGATFGAAVAIIGLGLTHTGSWAIPLCSFLGSLLVAAVILGLSRFKQVSSEGIVLAGVAISSMLTGATTLLQYFADEVALSSLVFWTFGDLGSTSWQSLRGMALAVLLLIIYCYLHRWDYNALLSGEETALSLGINVQRLTLTNVVLTCLVCSIIVSNVGLINFIGLVAPHIVRMVVGNNYIYLIPGSVLGISFLYAFNGPPFMLGGTVLIIVISLSIRRMPYTIRSSTAIIGQISPSVEEASISLGASQLKTFLRVTIPMMLPGVLSGAIMSWITLISELSSSVILYTSKTMTLTVAIYSEVIRSNFGNAAAYSTILTLTSIVSLLVFFKLSGKKDLSV